MTRRALRALVCGALLAIPGAVHAQRFDLSVTPATITFPSADPDLSPVLLSPPVTVTYRVRQLQGGVPWTLTILASGDLISGSSTVDISNVSWVASPAPPFQNGTLSKTVAQRLASGTGNVNPARDGQVTFRLANSWTFTAGIYTQTVVLTLSSP